MKVDEFLGREESIKVIKAAMVRIIPQHPKLLLMFEEHTMKTYTLADVDRAKSEVA